MKEKFVKVSILFLVLFFAKTIIFSQELDSLLNIVNNNETADTVRLQTYEKITSYYYRFDLDSMVYYDSIIINQVKIDEVTDRISKAKLQSKSNAINSIGIATYLKGDVVKALQLFETSLALNKKTKYDKAIASNLNNLAALYNSLGDVKKALNYYMESLKVREILKDQKEIAVSLNNLGTLYASQKEYKIALDYYKRSLKIRDSIGDMKGVSSVYTNLGILLKQKGDIKRALVYYKRALIIDLELNNKEGIIID